MNSENEVSSDDSDYSMDTYQYFKPDIILPAILNTDYKWNKNVEETNTMQKFRNLIGKITNLNIPDTDKFLIMYHITHDIITCHKNLNPHWKLLKQHALFTQIDTF